MLYLEAATRQTQLRCVTNRHDPSQHVNGRHGACCPLLSSTSCKI